MQTSYSLVIEVGPEKALQAQSMHGFKEAASQMTEDCQSDGYQYGENRGVCESSDK
jgi:hypothetical protein